MEFQWSTGVESYLNIVLGVVLMIRTGKGADSMNTCPVVSLIPPSVRCSEALPAHQCDGGQPQQRRPGGHMGASIAALRWAPVPVSLPLTHHCESSARLDGEPVTLLSLGGEKKQKTNSGSCQRKIFIIINFFKAIDTQTITRTTMFFSSKKSTMSLMKRVFCF